jgi:hypothetical protein
MKRKLPLIISLYCIIFCSKAQVEGDFDFGDISRSEAEMTVYPLDSSAEAVVLNEFGKASIDLDNDYNFRIFFYYHKRIKILNKSALDRANIEVYLGKSKESDQRKEKIEDITASTFSFESGKKKEFQFDNKKVFTENKTNYDIVKFTLSNVTEGSIIEFSYRTVSPFLWNFRTWHFQEDIPKVRSEYWTKIPATHIYNASLKGFLKLTKNDNSIQNDCLTLGSSRAQCSVNHYEMKNIPAFKEEEYMLSKHNFISSINYELRSYQGIDNGVVTKYTKEWKDVDLELRQRDDFGSQIRKGRYNFWDEKLSGSLAGVADSLLKAKKVYDFIKNWYTWNNKYGFLCTDGIKKAYEKRSGDISEINLSLISALRYAGIDAQPVILSTRDQGLPIELYPVLSDFNYVIAVTKIKGKTYYLDATDRFLPFGMLPIHCMNGKGRVISTDFKSDWVEIPNKEKMRSIKMINLKLDSSGTFTGTVSNTYFGYDGYSKRKEIKGFNTLEEYFRKVGERRSEMKIKSFKVNNLDNLDTLLIETMEVEIRGIEDLGADKVLLDPFVGSKWKENPFKSRERYFPVDFGMPFEIQTIVQLEFPETYVLPNVPPRIALGLPENGGKYLCNISTIGNKIMMNQVLTFNKPVYTSNEYHYIKELFNKVIESENIDLVFEKKKQ